MGVIKKVWSVHGIPVGMVGEEGWVKAATPLLSAFPETENPPQILLQFREAKKLPPIIVKERLFSYEGLKVYRCRKGICFTDGFSMVVGDPAGGIFVAWISPKTLFSPRFFSHVFCQVPLLEALRHRGFYPLHAACVVWEGKGLILVGGAGSGKTTTTLAFLGVGCQFVGDDMVLLYHHDEGVKVLTWSDEFHLDLETAKHFPAFRPLVVRGCAYRPGPKRAFSPREVLRDRWCLSCRPHWLFLLHRQEGKTKLEPLPSREAFRGLLSQSPMVFTDRRIAQKHLECLIALLHQCVPLRLLLGGDLLASPDRVAHRILQPFSGPQGA